MNEIKEVARAYYDGRTEEEKELAKQYFQSLDANGDGKVSLNEYKKMVDPFFSNQHIFKELDHNGDGTLDFDEVLTLYYMVQASIPKCNSCHDLLVGSYFSCLPCQGKASYCLCCSCYGGKKFDHQHSSTEFMDTRALLKMLDQLMEKAEVISSQTEPENARGNEDEAHEFKPIPPNESGPDRVGRIRRVIGVTIGVGNLANVAVHVGGAVAATTTCCIM